MLSYYLMSSHMLQAPVSSNLVLPADKFTGARSHTLQGQEEDQGVEGGDYNYSEEGNRHVSP